MPSQAKALAFKLAEAPLIPVAAAIQRALEKKRVLLAFRFGTGRRRRMTAERMRAFA